MSDQQDSDSDRDDNDRSDAPGASGRQPDGSGTALRSQRVEARDALRTRLRIIIFESETRAGRNFDILLLIAIVLSVAAVFMDSVPSINERWGPVLYGVEWFFTLLFTLEYVARLWCIEQPRLYARSYYGIVDLLGVVPTYLSLFIADSQYVTVVRILRVLRVFRVLRMVRWVSEASILVDALYASRRKILVFLFAVLALVVVFGSLLYVVEGPESGFTSIPISLYWAIVTLTTVGYGDIVPVTPVGRMLASMIMIMGYGVIAVPTGIVTMELNATVQRRANTRTCEHCSAEGHIREASYCWRCGGELFRRRARGEGGERDEGGEGGEGGERGERGSAGPDGSAADPGDGDRQVGPTDPGSPAPPGR